MVSCCLNHSLKFRVFLLLNWLPPMFREPSLFCYLIHSWWGATNNTLFFLYSKFIYLKELNATKKEGTDILYFHNAIRDFLIRYCTVVSTLFSQAINSVFRTFWSDFYKYCVWLLALYPFWIDVKKRNWSGVSRNFTFLGNNI